MKRSIIVVLTLVLAAAAGSAHDVKIVTLPHIAAYVGAPFDSWERDGVLYYQAPQVPAQAKTYNLDEVISCGRTHVPVAAWTEIVGSWPSIDVMYSVNAAVTEGRIEIAVRTRQGFSRGYAYIDILVLCAPKG